MKKNFLLPLALLAVVLIGCLLFGCRKEEPPAAEKPVTVVRLDVKKDTVPKAAEASGRDKFDVSVIEFNVLYSNGEEHCENMRMDYIVADDQKKFGDPGTHIVKFNFEGAQGKFQISLVALAPKKYLVEVKEPKEGGVEVSLDENVFEPLTFPYEKEFEEGKQLTFRYVLVPGGRYEFSKWTRNEDRDKVGTDREFRFTVTSDSVINVELEPKTYKILFYNGNTVVRTIFRNDLRPTDFPDGSGLDKIDDGYVFGGWTIRGCDEESDYYDNGSLDILTAGPEGYALNADLSLHATWRSLGLSFEEIRNGNELTGYRVKAYGADSPNLKIPGRYRNKPVTEIMPGAFKNARNLRILTIPSEMKIIPENGIFEDCICLEKITVRDEDALEDVSTSEDGFYSDNGVLYKGNGMKAELIACPAGRLSAEFVIGGDVSKIYDCAFKNALVGGVRFSNAETNVSIGKSAFDSPHITYVDFGERIPVVAEDAEPGGIFNENIEYIKATAAAENEDNRPLFDLHREKVVRSEDDFPELKVLDGILLCRDFYDQYSEFNAPWEIIGCDRAVSEIVVKQTVGAIGFRAFNGCYGLRDVIFNREKRLERISDRAFEDAPWLADKGDAIIENGIFYKYSGKSEEYVMPENVEKIAMEAFKGNETLRIIDFSVVGALRTIAKEAFADCSAFIGTDSGVNFAAGLTKIGARAFRGTAIKSVGLSRQTPPDLKTIGPGAFKNCARLLTVEFGENTTEVSPDAFVGCTALKEFKVAEQNAKYKSIDGILYGDIVEGEPKTLLAYPAGRMALKFDVGNPAEGKTMQFDVGNPAEGETLQITKLSGYSLWDSNIAGLVVPSSVEIIDPVAIRIPGLVYAEFSSEGFGRFTYADIFVGENKFEPEYITGGGPDTFPGFYGKNTSKDYSGKYLDHSPVLTDETGENGVKFMFLIADDVATVVGFSRDCEEAVIPNTAVEVPISKIRRYAYIGGYLETLRLGKNIVSLDENALVGAFELTRFYTDSENIGVVGIAKDESGKQLVFGEKFQNGLYIYAKSDLIPSYVDEWGGDGRYFIDCDKKYPDENGVPMPVARFAYREGEAGTPSEFDEIVGVIGGPHGTVPEPTREGYRLKYWAEDSAAPFIVDPDNVPREGCEIPYNVTLYCVWEADFYTVRLETAVGVGSDASVRYNEPYAFPNPSYEHNGRYLECWRTADGTLIPASGNAWTHIPPKGEICVLYPVWKEVKVELNYRVETPDGNIFLSATTSYDGEIRLDPTALSEGGYMKGYVFKGFADETGGRLSDETGLFFHRWAENINRDKISREGEDYVYAPYPDGVDAKKLTVLREAKKGTVKLYYHGDGADGKFFTAENVEYNAPFKFPYDASRIPDTDTEWKGEEKVSRFCGWYGLYDPDNETGAGGRKTDEDGNGINLWDFPWEGESGDVGEISLYAQWPVDVRTADDLNFTRSMFLVDDLTLGGTSGQPPQGAVGTAYEHTFNGNGHKVTVEYEYEYSEAEANSEKFFGGLFTENDGTIKNLVVKSTVKINITANITAGTARVCVGGLTGINRGIIKDVAIDSTVSATAENPSVEVSVGGMAGNNAGTIIITDKFADAVPKRTTALTVKADLLSGCETSSAPASACVGGFFGVNSGVVTGIGGVVKSLAVKIAGVAFVPGAQNAEQIAAGVLVGKMEGGSLRSGRVVEYRYTDVNDPFVGQLCGEKAGTAETDIRVISQYCGNNGS